MNYYLFSLEYMLVNKAKKQDTHNCLKRDAKRLHQSDKTNGLKSAGHPDRRCTAQCTGPWAIKSN